MTAKTSLQALLDKLTHKSEQHCAHYQSKQRLEALSDAQLSADQPEPQTPLFRNVTVQHTDQQLDQLIVAHYPKLSDALKLAVLLSYDDQDYIKALFEHLLQRKADPHGLQHYLQQLHNGTHKLVLLHQILYSDENQSKATPTQLRFPLKARLLLKSARYLSKLPHGQKINRKLLNLILADSQTLAQQLRFQLSLYQQADAALRQQQKQQTQQQTRHLTEVSATLRLLESKVNTTQLATQARLNALADQSPENQAHAIRTAAQDKLDAFYVAFEDACRGSQQQISEKQQHYLRYIDQATTQSKRIIDLGCGRGEWLELLNQQGYQAQGIDLNIAMIELCKQKQLDVTYQDAVAYLHQQPEQSARAITGFHIIEHLPFDVLYTLVEQAYRVLENNGLILFETPNPENILVGSHTFYHDPTHRNPITPTFISFLAQYHGFKNVEIVRTSPYPDEAKVPGFDLLTERVNGHLCGPQDFAIIAYKETP